MPAQTCKHTRTRTHSKIYTMSCLKRKVGANTSRNIPNEIMPVGEDEGGDMALTVEQADPLGTEFHVCVIVIGVYRFC